MSKWLKDCLSIIVIAALICFVVLFSFFLTALLMVISGVVLKSPLIGLAVAAGFIYWLFHKGKQREKQEDERAEALSRVGITLLRHGRETGSIPVESTSNQKGK